MMTLPMSFMISVTTLVRGECDVIECNRPSQYTLNEVFICSKS